MELKFKNITKCNKELYKQFLKFHNKKYKIKELLKTLLVLLLFLYIMIFNIIYKNYLMIPILIILIVLYIFLKNYKRKTAVKKQLKTSKIVNEEVAIFSFYKGIFYTQINGKKSKTRYYKIYRIHEDNNNIYIYLDETHALILSKKGFVVGTVKEFRNFLSKKCKFKYKK